MTEWHDGRLDPELREVADRLRAGRPQISAVELDRIKLHAKARALTTRKGIALRSRLIAPLVALGLMGGGTAGVLAGGQSNGGNGENAGNNQYCPPKNGSSKGSHSSHGNRASNGSHGSHCPPPPPRGSNGSNKGGSHNSHKQNRSNGGSHQGSNGGGGHHGS